MKQFDYSLDFKNIDFRQHPELYRVGKGEQGVLLVEPYKGEILPFWRFKTPEIARESSSKIYSLFLEYLDREDFVGADMARKFLQMGYTRSRRYANHKSGRKYQQNPQKLKSVAEQSAARKDILPLQADPVKAESAAIFQEKWMLAKINEKYLQLLARHRRKYQQNPQKLKSVAEQSAARKDILPLQADPVKAESAAIFQEKWMLAKINEKYLQLLARHRQMYESYLVKSED